MHKLERDRFTYGLRLGTIYLLLIGYAFFTMFIAAQELARGGIVGFILFASLAILGAIPTLWIAQQSKVK